jgi:hypothetical protein
MALITALTPLGKVAPDKWIRATLAYALAGGASSVLVGASLGSLSRHLGVTSFSRPLPVLGIAVILAAREFGWITFAIPQAKRQTNSLWAHQFGFTIGAAMWGFDIGLGFTTLMTHGSLWFLAIIVLLIGKPAIGAWLLLAYWCGRLAPLLMSRVLVTENVGEFAAAVGNLASIYNAMVGFTLIWTSWLIYLRIGKTP